MNRFGLLLDDRFKLHDTGPGHPERPARLDAVAAGLEDVGAISAATRIEPRAIDDAHLHEVHDPRYVERVARHCAAGRRMIDTADSAISERSDEIARLAAGGIAQAAQAIARGELTRAFCAVRPPGHHAERGASMGFCLYANVVLAARAFQRHSGFERVAIVDWDVHHGNGTQHILEDDPSVLFISIHQHPDTLYPGTGYAHERGRGAGEGFTLNLPMPPGSGDDDYLAVFDQEVTPALQRFAPAAIIISAGFDAHKADPLAQVELTDDAFTELSRSVAAVANQHAAGRILSVLEGGYALDALRQGVANHARVLMKE